MNKEQRKKMVVAMEYIVRNVNDETAMNGWLMCGVPDGDIEYGDLSTENVDEYFIQDNTFAELMGCFMRTMKRAQNGGLYMDGITSKED